MRNTHPRIFDLLCKDWAKGLSLDLGNAEFMWWSTLEPKFGGTTGTLFFDGARITSRLFQQNASKVSCRMLQARNQNFAKGLKIQPFCLKNVLLGQTSLLIDKYFQKHFYFAQQCANVHRAARGRQLMACGPHPTLQGISPGLRPFKSLKSDPWLQTGCRTVSNNGSGSGLAPAQNILAVQVWFGFTWAPFSRFRFGSGSLK